MSGTEYWITIIFQLCMLLIRSAVSILGSPIMSRSSVFQFQWDLIVVASDISFTNSKVNYFGVSSLLVLMFEMVSVQFFSNLIGFIFFSASKSKWCNGRWHGFRFSMLEFIYTVWVGKFCGFMCLSKCIVCGETDSVYVGTICLQSSMLIW